MRKAGNASCTGEAIDFGVSATSTVISNDFSMSGGDGYPNFSERIIMLGILNKVVAPYLSGATDGHATADRGTDRV